MTHRPQPIAETCGRLRGTLQGQRFHRRRKEPQCAACGTEQAGRTRVLKDNLSNWTFG